MQYIAHRGKVIDGVIENSVKAFKNALEDPKYSGIELDLRTSKDGKFVIYHDFLIKGKLVSSMTFEELQKEGVDSLEDVLKIETSKIIMIEIKESNIDIIKLVLALNKSNLNIYVMSFHNNVINKLSKEKINFKLGVLNYVLNSEKDYSHYNFIALLEYSITLKVIESFLKKGIEVFVYGITDLDLLKSISYPIYAIVDETGSYFN